MKNKHEVIVFHDETEFTVGKKIKGHVLFFVPIRMVVTSNTPFFGDWVEEYSPLSELYETIKAIREINRVNKKFHFTDISGKKWVSDDLAARIILGAAVDSLRSKRSEYFKRAMRCKYSVIFYNEKVDLSLYGGDSSKEKRLRYDETLLRMLLKGSLNFLYNREENVHVRMIVSDGNPYHRDLDKKRIINQIAVDIYKNRTPLRGYATFADKIEILGIKSDHRIYEPSSPYHIYANILQIADLLLGSTIRACQVGCKDFPTIPRQGDPVGDKKDRVAFPVKEMLDKTKRGGGFVWSGQNRSFTISEIDFNGGEISFSQVRPIDMSFPELGPEGTLF